MACCSAAASEGEIRRRIIEDDLLDTVIGPRPEPVLRHRHPRRRADPAGQGIQAARAAGQGAVHQRRPRLPRGPGPEPPAAPATSRRSPPLTAASPTYDGFARVVTVEELANNDFNCNIRRYADNSPPPRAPRRARPTSTAGVPMTEIDAAAGPARAGRSRRLWRSCSSDRGDGYADWCHNIASPKGRDAAHGAIGYAVAQRAAASPWPQWWAGTVEPMLRALPRLATTSPACANSSSRISRPTWPRRGWNALPLRAWPSPGGRKASTSSKLRSAGAWKAVIEAWLTTAEASQDDKNAPDLADQIAIKVLAGTAVGLPGRSLQPQLASLECRDQSRRSHRRR